MVRWSFLSQQTRIFQDKVLRYVQLSAEILRKERDEQYNSFVPPSKNAELRNKGFGMIRASIRRHRRLLELSVAIASLHLGQGPSNPSHQREASNKSARQEAEPCSVNWRSSKSRQFQITPLPIRETAPSPPRPPGRSQTCLLS